MAETFIFTIAFIALCLAALALLACRALWVKVFPKVAEKPSEGREEVPSGGTKLAPGARPLIVGPSTGVDFESEAIWQGEAFRCNSCRKVKRQSPEFITQIDLDMPFLDSTLPIHVSVCEECVNAQA